MSIRLAKLADRTPVRMNVALAPELASALRDYAEIYGNTNGTHERPETLIPAMLENFLVSDAGFKRARRALNANKGD